MKDRVERLPNGFWRVDWRDGTGFVTLLNGDGTHRSGPRITREVQLGATGQPCRDCGEVFPYDPDADRCPQCVAGDGIEETREQWLARFPSERQA